MDPQHPTRVADPPLDELRSFLDGRWGWARDETRKILRNPLFHPAPEADLEAARARCLEQAFALAQTRGPKLGFPVAYGGEGDVGGFVTGFETLAYGDLSLLVKVGVQWGLFGGAILHLGTEHHHDRYLSDLMSLRLPGCFAMTETGHGSDVQSLRTTATFDPASETFTLDTPDEDARKDYIGNAARDGRVAVVFARLETDGDEHGVHAFVVPIRNDSGEPSPGVTIEDCGHKMGLNGVDNGRITFDHVRVPREALLDKHAQVGPDGKYSSPIENRTRRFFTMVGTLIQGRVSISGAAINAAKVGQTIAIRYSLTRRQFSPPGSDRELLLLDYRQHQRRLLPSLAKTYALHFAQEALVAQLHEAFTTQKYPERERRKLESDAAGIKAVSTWHATHTIQTCREACGGAGYLTENRLPQLKADTDVFTTFEGDNTVLLQLVAKGLLTDYREEFGDLDTIGMIRFATDLVIDQVLERTAGARHLIQSLIDSVPRAEADTDIYDKGYHLELFEWRERHVLEGVARRIKRAVDGDSDPFEAFNSAQDHVLIAAEAHVERLILEAFVEAIARCDSLEVTGLLDQVCCLYALSTIEQNRGWYFEHGRLSPERSKAITRTVNDLCSGLRKNAALLVDAFGIPDEVLAAPITLGRERDRQAAREKDQVETGLPGFAPPPP